MCAFKRFNIFQNLISYIDVVKVLITLGQLLWTKRLRAYNL